MLKRLLIVCITLILYTPSKAQHFNAGVFGGITASQVDGDSYGGFNKLGLLAGGYVNMEMDYSIYWQTGIKFVTRGVYQGPTQNYPALFGSSYRYIELPLSLHYLHEEKIQIEAGFSPEVLISVRFWDEDGNLHPSTYPDNRRFGLSVFGGVYYWLNRNVGLGIRYTYSAIPFRDPQEWNHPRYRGYYHNVLAVTAMYSFITR